MRTIASGGREYPMNKGFLGTIALICLPIGSAFAQQEEVRSGLLLSLESQAVFVDNFYYQQDDDDQENAFGVLVKPDVGLRHASRRLLLTGTASAEIGTFNQPSDTADYADYAFALGAEWALASRHRLTYAGSLEHDHDAFGTERTELDALADARIDEWRRVINGLSYRFGAPTDRLNLVFGGNHLDKTYTTNEEFTQFLDHSITSGELTGYYNYSPKTSFFLSLVASAIDFDEVFPGTIDLDADERSFRAGVRWAASAKTSGEIAAGYLDRSPSDTRRNDFSSVDWRVQLTWAPTSYRTLRFASGRNSQETFISTVSFINNEFYMLRWNESWTQRVSSMLSVGFLDSEFVGSTRTDEAVSVEGSLEYRLARSLDLFAGFRWVDRESDQLGTAYERSHGFLGMRYTN